MSSFRLLIAVVALLGSVSAARAELIFVHYEGILGSVPQELSSAFTAGDSVSGDFAFDPTVAPRDVSPDGASAVYDNLRSYSIQIGPSYFASFTNSLDGREIQIEDGTPTNGRTDRILVLALASSGLVGPTVNGFVIDSAGPHLEDFDNTALSGIGIPFGAKLSDFELATIGITFTDNAPAAAGGVGIAAFVGMDARLTSIQFTGQPVPEPSTLVMLSTGALALIGVGVQRRRSRPTSA